MKRYVSIAFLLVLGLAACGGSSAREPDTQLTVFAAASMSGVLLELADRYTAENPHINLTFNFDSSGTLRTQILEGADADLFLSAATQEMTQLEEEGFVLGGTRVHFLENQLVLVAAPGNPSDIESFADMADALLVGDTLLAMGNMDVPAGRYARELLAALGLNHETLARAGVISYGSNVREVAMQVREASVDMGMVYLTDALDFGLEVVDIAAPEMVGRVIYPAAVLDGGQNQDAAMDFLSFLAGEEAMAVFAAWGFTSTGMEGSA